MPERAEKDGAGSERKIGNGVIHKLFAMAGGLLAGAAETVFSGGRADKKNNRALLNYFFGKTHFCH